MDEAAWQIRRGEGALVAAAIHSGHDVRAELAPLLALPEAERLREEDPFTERWTPIAPSRIVVTRSRFEVDMNRDRERAVYLRPEDAWGLRVWREELPYALLNRSYRVYEGFYQDVEALLGGLIERHGRIVVLDLHTYNHRRQGALEKPESPETAPTVNLGTSTINLTRWGPVLDRFEASLRACVFRGNPLDVRRDVKFRGGHFVRWIHRTFSSSACALAIEVKKVFMDEWTGELDEEAHAELGRALAAAAEDVRTLLAEGSM